MTIRHHKNKTNQRKNRLLCRRRFESVFWDSLQQMTASHDPPTRILSLGEEYRPHFYSMLVPSTFPLCFSYAVSACRTFTSHKTPGQRTSTKKQNADVGETIMYKVIQRTTLGLLPIGTFTSLSPLFASLTKTPVETNCYC